MNVAEAIESLNTGKRVFHKNYRICPHDTRFLVYDDSREDYPFPMANCASPEMAIVFIFRDMHTSYLWADVNLENVHTLDLQFEEFPVL